MEITRFEIFFIKTCKDSKRSKMLLTCTSISFFSLYRTPATPDRIKIYKNKTSYKDQPRRMVQNDGD